MYKAYLSAALIVTSATSLEAQMTSNSPGTVTVETPLAIIDRIRPPERRNPGSGPHPLNFREVFSAENYPELATEREVEGRVMVRVQVNAEGLPTHCETLGNPPAELGGPTCALILAKARFAPKLDRKGHAVKGEFRQEVRWVLEDLEPEQYADRFDRIIFNYDDDATILGCRRERSANAPPIEKDEVDPCKGMAFAAKVIAAVEQRDDLSDWEARFEVLNRTGDVEFWRSVGEGPDEHLFSRVGFRLAIKPDGSVGDCKALDPVPEFTAMPVTCEQMKRGRFVESSEPSRTLYIVNVAYLKRKTPVTKTT